MKNDSQFSQKEPGDELLALNWSSCLALSWSWSWGWSWSWHWSSGFEPGTGKLFRLQLMM